MADCPKLPPQCQLRQATQADIWAIRRLVLGAILDPTQLRWQQFWVVECQGKVIACGQLRNFADAQELGSLVVSKPWRDRDLGTILTQHLIAQGTQPLYLECLGKKLVKYYQKLGFVPVKYAELPPSLQDKFKASQVARRFLGVPIEFMQWAKKRRI
ncbi:MAG: GNAT family N-acetyltransferase [Spirulinaceae cyanobacterium]